MLWHDGAVLGRPQTPQTPLSLGGMEELRAACEWLLSLPLSRRPARAVSRALSSNVSGTAVSLHSDDGKPIKTVAFSMP
jgi:hypothetical protein